MFVRNLPGLRLSVVAGCLLGLPALVLLPSNAQALGLGDIHLKSTLDAPLSADIDVVDANADDLSTLKASLASRDTFSHFGADYPAFLGTLSFTTQRTADGHAVIHVTSSGVADEPFATLLIEADWARGHVVREYTVLLDPPVFNSKAPSNAAVAAPQVDSGARSGSIDHPEAAAAAASAAAAAAPSGAGNSAETASASTPASTAPSTPSGSTPGEGTSASATASAAPTVHHRRAKAAGAASASAAAGAAGAGGSGAAKPSSSEQQGNGAAGSTYTVRAGDTLSSIATQTYSPSNRRARDQALVAIFRANPNAFAGKNMNALRAGSQLNLPGDDELAAVGPGEASTEVRSQYDAWRSAHGGATAGAPGATSAEAGAGAAGQLRLVAPQETAQQAASNPSNSSSPNSGPGNAAAGGAGNGSNAALQQRVQQLESQLADSQRLLQLKNSQLADMQARLANQGNAAAAAATPATPPASVAAPSPPVATPSAPVTPTPPPPVNASTPTPATPAASPATATPPVVAARPHPPVHRPVAAHPKAKPAPSTSVLGLLTQYWYVLALVVLALIGFVVMRARRARREDAFDRSLGRLSPELESDVAQPRTDTMPVRTMAPREEPSYSVEESGTHQQPVFDEPLPTTDSGKQRVAIDEGMTGEVPVALDQGDPLAEADFHMAYGLYDQAAELVQNAIAREPQRRDLKLKLLEVFFVWGNKERFLQSAHELADTRNQAPAGEWEKIVIMGRQIAPEDALFADGRAVAGAASAGVDLNLEGGQNRVDFDLLGEPSLAAAAPDGAVDLDLGTALGQADPDRTHNRLGAADPTGQAHTLGSSVDFDLEGAQPSSADATGSTLKMPGAPSGTGTTREMPAVPAAARGLGDTERVAMGGAELTADAPTVEQPHLRQDENATIRQKLDAAARNGMLTGEQTAELAIDDLGLDLGALEAPVEEHVVANSPDAPTMLAEVDATARQTLARAAGDRVESGGTTQVRAAPTGQMRATGTWMFTDTDFAKMAPVKGPGSGDATQQAKTELVAKMAEAPQIDTSSTSRLTALDTSDLDLDLSSLGSLNDEPAGAVDLDVGAGAQEHAAPNGNGHDEEALPDLEPVTLSEVGTKLDLARAYMDMGDPEGARSILSEVLSEGSLSQKQEARRLMDALPG